MKIKLSVFACYIFLHTVFDSRAYPIDHGSTKSFEWAIFPLKDGRLRVNITNHQLERMVVIIKNEKGEVIQKNFIDKKTEKPAISYDISSLESGNYKVHLLSKSGAETKDFQLNIVRAQSRFLTIK
ncbi:DUF3244 domain-containing protein [Dyadobacter chenwenxiniae]|uniref:DUF3244 domain-containing protein n=1 Tax=Dyadobacter chenwenxiniae TaxID=2906456 RepID=A0A9X1PT64_9BACT|nr:DUF3244 domain-containing protein [Dyadobacter chenwenxiniae]MCF0064701.1 DUF3244 domain-containing protein [Dyadobacter chenwenxiniae]UON84245.1 DUF3244 domain-containing protein [Dyadobacter chenwenxiniae]